MPYSMDNPPAVAKDLPKHALEIFMAAFNSAFKEYDGNEQKSFSVAWAAVKQKYEQDKDGNWKAKKAEAITELWEKVKRLFDPLIGEFIPSEMIAYLPTQTRSLVITRDAQGNPRWLGIAASAVVNKVGAIDSTALFDNFIKHAKETGEYPVMDFWHEGDKIRFGQADWLWREGVLYIASGPFDDTDLGHAAADGLEANPGYWGMSIAYRVTQEPLMLISEGQIPVYMDGLNTYISIVPKRMAANLFTTVGVSKEVMRMSPEGLNELVKLVGEERARPFADDIDDANRTATETGMITRVDETPPAAPVVESAPEATPTTEATPIVTRPDAPPAPAADMPQMDLAKMQAMMEAMDARIKALEEKYGAGVEESTRMQERATTAMTDLTSRLAAVEASKGRWDTWLNDAPEYVKAEAETIYRARNQPVAPQTAAEVAAATTAKMNKGPHYSRQH